MGRARTDHEHGAMRGIDESGGDAPQQQASTSGQPTGPNHQEVLGVPPEVIEEALEHFSVKRYRLYDRRAMGQSTLAKLFEHRHQSPPVVTEGNQRVESGHFLSSVRRTNDGDGEGGLESSRDLGRHLDRAAGLGRPVEPDEDTFEHAT